MNEAWEWRPLGDLFEIGAGKTMSAAARDGTDKTPFLRTSNVLWDEIDLTSVDEMSIPNHEFPAKLLRRGDLLVCEGGEIGRAAIWPGEIEPMSYQNHLHRLRPMVPNVEPRFYVYFLQSAFTQLGLFEGTGNKTTIPNLSRSRLAALSVPQPPLSEQRAISTVLSTVRAAIKVQDRSIEITRYLKQVAMQALFTRGLRGEPQKETEIGPIPESWELSPLSNHAREVQYGLSMRGSILGRCPILRMNCQQDGRVVLRDLQYVDVDDATFREYKVKRGDLLFNRTNSFELVGRTAIVDLAIDAVFASYLIRVSAEEDKLDPSFLNYFLNWDVTQHELKKLASRGVSQANISAGKLRQFRVAVPQIDEQRQIISVLDAIHRKTLLHRTNRDVLEELFKGLLHKLMTGEIPADELHTTGTSGISEVVPEKRTGC